MYFFLLLRILLGWDGVKINNIPLTLPLLYCLGIEGGRIFKINLKLAWGHSLPGWQGSGQRVLILYPHYIGSWENLGFSWSQKNVGRAWSLSLSCCCGAWLLTMSGTDPLRGAGPRGPWPLLAMPGLPALGFHDTHTFVLDKGCLYMEQSWKVEIMPVSRAEQICLLSHIIMAPFRATVEQICL